MRKLAALLVMAVALGTAAPVFAADPISTPAGTITVDENNGTILYVPQGGHPPLVWVLVKVDKSDPSKSYVNCDGKDPGYTYTGDDGKTHTTPGQAQGGRSNAFYKCTDRSQHHVTENKLV